MAGAEDGTEAGQAPRRPSWLDEACPRWCTRDHREEDHPEDRYHQGEPSVFTAVAGSGDGAPPGASLQPMALGVRIGRQVGEERTWLLVEPIDGRRPRAVLSLDAAQALARHLTRQLTLADPRD